MLDPVPLCWLAHTSAKQTEVTAVLVLREIYSTSQKQCLTVKQVHANDLLLTCEKVIPIFI